MVREQHLAIIGDGHGDNLTFDGVFAAGVPSERPHLSSV
jgi:hypothetical protein